MLRAVIFDFDGTLIDTEVPWHQAWQEIYQQYQVELPLSLWGQSIGTHGAFDPIAHLESLTSIKLDQETITALHRRRALELIALQPLRPGIWTLIRQARQAGLKLGIASSSHLDWVMPYLERFSLSGYFDTLCTADDVERIKPDPSLYTLALERVEVAPQEAVAIEDSLNGALAARRAGLACLVVPNPATSHFTFPADAIQLASLKHVDVPYLATLCGASSSEEAMIACDQTVPDSTQ
jgi:HAD superfamily hydrolase (TIGR01509 family)